MKRGPRSQLAIAAALAASFAGVALGVAAPPGATGDAMSYFLVPGHVFGLGEQQVYLIDRETQLVVRYRDGVGDLRSKALRQHVHSSVAWTIEGISSSGGPVLGVATAAQATTGVATPAATQSGSMIELAPLSLILSSMTVELPQIGKPWKSSGDLQLPYGRLTVNLDNVLAGAPGNQDVSVNVAQIASTGRTDFQAKVKVAGFGDAALRGAGSATSTSFVESQNKLLLGMTLAATSYGNATAKERRGTYDLSVKIAIKLVRYVPGIPPGSGSPGFGPASGYLGGTAAPDTQIYATANPDKIAIPAATDTGYVPPPAQPTPPYPSALPAVSLPPIPLPMASDVPAASPPAGPTPTPQPTHY